MIELLAAFAAGVLTGIVLAAGRRVKPVTQPKLPDVVDTVCPGCGVWLVDDLADVVRWHRMWLADPDFSCTCPECKTRTIGVLSATAVWRQIGERQLAAEAESRLQRELAIARRTSIT